MIEFLTKRFIKEPDRLHDPVTRAAYGTLVSVVAIIFNILLFGAKFIIGTMAGSVSITADAVNNLTDAGSALLLFVGFKLANTRPAPDRPFGHGRIEYITGLVVSVLIILTGFELGRSSVEKLIHPQPIEFSWLAVTVLALAILVKLYMGAFTRRIAKKIDSSAMEATAADYTTDAVSTGVALLCMLIFRFFGRNLDAVGGIVVALLILRTGIESAKETLLQLLGQKPDAELVARVEELVMSFPEICGLHDLIIHDYGPGRLFISLHAEVDGSGNIYALHDTMDCAMNLLDKELGCESVIHMDPIDLNDAELAAKRGEVTAIVTAIDPALKMHDFRMVPGPTHTNLIFDVLVPFRFSMTDEELRARISDEVKKLYPDHFCVIKVDKAYA